MLRCSALALAAFVVSLGAGSTAHAQGSSMFPKGFGQSQLQQIMSQFGGSGGLGGMSGMGGMGGMSGGMGGGLSSGMSGGSFGGLSASGGGSLGGMAGGMGGGMGGVSGNNFGGSRAGSGFGANAGGAGMGMMGQGQNGFVGRNNAGQFVGMNNMTGGMQGMNGNRQMLNGGNRNLGGLNGMQNFNQNMGSQAQSQPIPLRAQQRIAFEYPRATAPVVTTQVQARFNKLSVGNPAMKGVTFESGANGSVVLRGEVASQSAARIAEKLARLEPGVKSVRSELTYPASTANK